jgi:hypothetical protein
MTQQLTAALPSLVQTIAASWRIWRRRLAARAELTACGSEVEAIAHDLHMTVYELDHLAGLPPASAKLLPKRMQLRGVDPKKLSLPVLNDMQRVCSNCSAKRRCSRDLKHNNAAVASYCPNEPTFQALDSGRRARHVAFN